VDVVFLAIIWLVGIGLFCRLDADLRMFILVGSWVAMALSPLIEWAVRALS
jgi:hypothetical protein